MLMVWIINKQLAGDSVTEMIQCEKASAIYQDLKVNQIGENLTSDDTFKVSRGWIGNFKNALEKNDKRFQNL